MARYRLQWTLEGHRGPVNCVAFTEDGAILASGADDGHILLWSLADGKLCHRLRPKQGPVICIRWLSRSQLDRGYRLLAGGADGTVQLWGINRDLISSEQLSSHTVLNGPIEDITVDDTCQAIVVIGLGRVVVFTITDAQGRDPLRFATAEPPFSQGAFAALARTAHFFCEGKCILVCFLDAKEIIAWNMSPWKMIWRQKLQTRIGSTAWHEATRTLLVWNLVDGIDVYRFTDNPTNRFGFVRKLRVRIKRNHINLVQLSASGNFAISGSDNGEVYIWDVESGRQTQVLGHSKGMVLNMQSTPRSLICEYRVVRCPGHCSAFPKRLCPLV
ncbi:WD40 repeat-like protein [Leucogyrophana mollusca]|uniref:WD40 repeat-like protein n=1 Tax=Leucogyrophana mollusca TaxID=85980 RepID=A0ACB8B0C8_9AGAM|nr:WD40 repeat-like protein [Leucogyrophana mollusca]